MRTGLSLALGRNRPSAGGGGGSTLEVTYVHGSDGFGIYDGADFPDGIDDDSEIIEGGVILTPQKHSSDRYGANAMFPVQAVDDSNTYRVDFTREQLVQVSTNTAEDYSSNARYQQGLIIGLIFNKEHNEISFSGQTNNTETGVTSNNNNNMAVIKLGRFNLDEYGRFSSDGAWNFDATGQDNGSPITDVGFEITKDGTGWLVNYYVNGSSAGSHDLYNLTSDLLTKFVPFCHNGLYSVAVASSEKITDVTVTES